MAEMSPEERLLKVIETPIEEAKDLKWQTKKDIKNERSGFLELLGIHDPQAGSFKKRILSYLTFKSLNRFLAGLCVLVLFFWIFDFFSQHITFSRRFLVIEKRLEDAMGESLLSEQQNENKKDLKEAMTRNVFTLAPTKIEVESQGTDYNQMVADLKVVGIIWSDNPQAMIESKKEAKTFLLNKHDKIQQLTIKEIRKDKVVVTAEGREWELR